MPKYRYPVPRHQAHVLEAYYFKLCCYLNTTEFVQLNTFEQKRIYDEINYMSIVLGVLDRIYVDGANNEQPLYAWPLDPEEFGYDALFRFSCAKVAGMALGISNTAVGKVCRGQRESIKGWCFVFESEFDPEIHGNTTKRQVPKF